MTTAEQLRQALDCDPHTGGFTWKISTSNRAPVGSTAGTGSAQGYRRIRVFGPHPTAGAAREAYLAAKQRLHPFNPILRKDCDAIA